MNQPWRVLVRVDQEGRFSSLTGATSTFPTACNTRFPPANSARRGWVRPGEPAAGPFGRQATGAAAGAQAAVQAAGGAGIAGIAVAIAGAQAGTEQAAQAPPAALRRASRQASAGRGAKRDTATRAIRATVRENTDFMGKLLIEGRRELGRLLG